MRELASTSRRTRAALGSGLLPMAVPLLLPALTRLVDGCAPDVMAQGYHAFLVWAEHVLPSVFGALEGRDSAYAPMSLALVSGLTTSTILTLVVMPTLYSLIDDLGAWIKRMFAAA